MTEPTPATPRPAAVSASAAIHDSIDWQTSAHGDFAELIDAAITADPLLSAAGEMDKACDEALAERDHATDKLQETHLALGGDGEWRGRMPPQDPPNSGDLHYDVPAMARLVRKQAGEMAEALKEVWDSIPSTYNQNDSMVKRHAKALTAIPGLLKRAGIE